MTRIASCSWLVQHYNFNATGECCTYVHNQCKIATYPPTNPLLNVWTLNLHFLSYFSNSLVLRILWAQSEWWCTGGKNTSTVWMSESDQVKGEESAVISRISTVASSVHCQRDGWLIILAESMELAETMKGLLNPELYGNSGVFSSSSSSSPS